MMTLLSKSLAHFPSKEMSSSDYFSPRLNLSDHLDWINRPVAVGLFFPTLACLRSRTASAVLIKHQNIIFDVKVDDIFWHSICTHTHSRMLDEIRSNFGEALSNYYSSVQHRIDWTMDDPKHFSPPRSSISFFCMFERDSKNNHFISTFFPSPFVKMRSRVPPKRKKIRKFLKTIAKRKFSHLAKFKLQFTTIVTWCRAVNPSTFAVLMSAPPVMSMLRTSSLSAAAQAARKMHPAENLTFLSLAVFGNTDSRLVSESSYRLSCSTRFEKAVLLRAITIFHNLFFSSKVSHFPSIPRPSPLST